MFDQGTGPPLIVVPGVQGRWEWMAPALQALGRRCRTISYTLCGDIGSGVRFDPTLGFENYVRQLDAVFERKGIARAALCGVSYGGLVALRYAARRSDRVSALILVSAPSPDWQPSERQRRQIDRPWRSAPGFVLGAPVRIWPEIVSALPDWRAQLAFAVRHGLRVISAPMVPSRMAARVKLEQALDFRGDCTAIDAPTLVITGEEELDTVVPVRMTQRYCSLIARARYEQLTGTGHIGLVTQPERFAAIIGEFLHAGRD